MDDFEVGRTLRRALIELGYLLDEGHGNDESET